MSLVWKLPIAKYIEISSDYGWRTNPTHPEKGNEFHCGIDFAEGKGTPILAAADGEVFEAGWSDGGFGYHVRIKHEGDLTSIYGHASKVVARKGQIVKAGDVIAEVGTTGNSTGNHLHFEIRHPNSKNKYHSVNPRQYIPLDSNTAVVNNPNYTYNPDIQYASDGSYAGTSGPVISTYSEDATGTTVGQRVSGVTPQPLHPFVNIYIGEDMKPLVTDPAKPNIIQSFRYDRLHGSAGETATFTLFDNNWDEIEEVLSNNFDRIYVQYGYHGTGLKSKVIQHRMSTYTLSFNNTGALLALQSNTEGVRDNLKPRNILVDTFNPTEAVKKICKELGYTVLEENFDESQDISAANPFNVLEEYPLAYIQNVIVPQAAQVNEEIFTFHVDSDNVAYFKRRSYALTSATDTMRTYIYQKGYDSNVLSIEFDIKGIFGGSGDFSVDTGYRLALFDSDTKTSDTFKVDKSSVVTAATGDVTHTSSEQSDPVVDGAGYTATQMKNKLYYRMKHMRSDAYTARMTIVGDPTLEMFQLIRVINVTDKGELHHTSGVYYITGITDEISGGKMTTALELQRNGAYNIDGVEILNPKSLLK